MFLALSCPSKESFKTGTIRWAEKLYERKKISRKEGKDAERKKKRRKRKRNAV